MSRLTVELASTALPQVRIGCVTLLIKPLVASLMDWFNERIRSEDGNRDQFGRVFRTPVAIAKRAGKDTEM